MKSCQSHNFQDIEELHTFRRHLLGWYDRSKRDLPWRSSQSTQDLSEDALNVRAYGVWVSEVMLQQTQVATVVDYYTKWMKKWPTVESLAAATLEEVCAMWAGLGYYSRGERLWKGAQKVVSEMGGAIPSTPEELVKGLPGVGRYTAGAIASIAFNKEAAIVDGNVERVLCRQRAIGGQTNSQAVNKHLWTLAEVCVDKERPGDFNQAMMELGATVCTPRNPRCGDCPVSASCHALQQVRQERPTSSAREGGEGGGGREGEGGGGREGEGERCPLCLAEWDKSLGITNYPQKAKKKAPHLEKYCVAVIEDQDGQFLLKQRPASGLLAGLWEFPGVLQTTGDDDVTEKQPDQLQGICGELCEQLVTTTDTWPQWKSIGEVTHQFSHVHHCYQCWHLRVQATPPGGGAGLRWVARSDLTKSAVPASVRKIVQLLDSKPARKKRTASSTLSGSTSKRQKKLDSFFTKARHKMKTEQ